jgi:hypothetical protein
MAANKPAAAPRTVKLSDQHRKRLSDLLAEMGGIPPEVLILAGLHALEELSPRERVRVIVECVEGTMVHAQRRHRSRGRRARTTRRRAARR